MSLLFNSLTPLAAAFPVYAQEATPSAEQEQTAEATLESSPLPEPTPETVVDQNLTTPPATQSAVIDTTSTENQSSVSLAPPVWQTNEDGFSTTINNVVLNQTYVLLLPKQTAQI
ncbi:hypothetical protein HYS92_00655 [Candidatus Daviesbacteria bacterium]|nr:hypothetical protein [Candidatus Daviesbacteria bacterium]